MLIELFFIEVTDMNSFRAVSQDKHLNIYEPREEVNSIRYMEQQFKV